MLWILTRMFSESPEARTTRPCRPRPVSSHLYHVILPCFNANLCWHSWQIVILQTQVQYQIITCPSLTLPPVVAAVCLPVGPSEPGLHVPPECLQVHTVLQEVCPVPDHGPDEELWVRHGDVTWPAPHQRGMPSLPTRIAFSTLSTYSKHT